MFAAETSAANVWGHRICGDPSHEPSPSDFFLVADNSFSYTFWNVQVGAKDAGTAEGGKRLIGGVAEGVSGTDRDHGQFGSDRGEERWGAGL